MAAAPQGALTQGQRKSAAKAALAKPKDEGAAQVSGLGVTQHKRKEKAGPKKVRPYLPYISPISPLNLPYIGRPKEGAPVQDEEA